MSEFPEYQNLYERANSDEFILEEFEISLRPFLRIDKKIEIPLTFLHSLSTYTIVNDCFISLKVNNNEWGWAKDFSGSLIFQKDEYVSDFKINARGSRFTSFWVKTNTGRLLSAGDASRCQQHGRFPGDDIAQEIEGRDGRILGVGAVVTDFAGDHPLVLTTLKIMWASNFTPSIIALKSITCVVGIVPPNSTFEVVETFSEKVVQTFQKTLSLEITRNMNMQASFEFMAKFSGSTAYNTVHKDISVFSQELHRTYERIEKQTFATEANYAFIVSKYDLMKDPSGRAWVSPNSELVTLVLTPEQYGNLGGAYALVAGLDILLNVELEDEGGIYRIPRKQTTLIDGDGAKNGIERVVSELSEF